MRTEYLLNKQIERVLDLLTPQNRLVMRVILHTGLRVSDALSLRKEQLKPRIWITEKKTGKRRQIGFPAPLLDDLCKNAGEKWVFEGRKSTDTHRTRQAVWHDVKRAAMAYRLPQNIGTHSARKVYAVRLREKYGDIKKVQKALQHSSVEVTLLYAMADVALNDKYHLTKRA